MHGSTSVLFLPPCQCVSVGPMLTCHCTDTLLYSSWIQNLCPFFRVSCMVDGAGMYLLIFLNLNDFQLNYHIKAF